MEKRKNILVIEDNPRIFLNYIKALKEQYNVVVTENETSAKERLQLRRFDLAIVDMMMPPRGLNEDVEYHAFRAGLEFYDSFIRINYPKMPIIIWSSIDKSLVYQVAKQILGENANNLNYCNKDSILDLLNKVDEILNQ